VIFGQKTLQLRPSSLDRINVRRLLILAKRTVAGFARNLLFEPNNPSTWTRFVNKVNPVLEGYRKDQGINRFKVVMDNTTNTSDVIDRNEMRGKIFLEPVRAAEFITIDFVITPSGVAFGS
jgi:phage tail sheath protein FI